MPFAAAAAAPAATSAGPRSAPPASTATVTIGRGLAGLGGALVQHLAALVGAAHGTDPVRKPRAVALRAEVVTRGLDLVLGAALGGARVRLLLLRDCHGESAG